MAFVRRQGRVNTAAASQRRRRRNSDELPGSRFKCSSWAGKTGQRVKGACGTSVCLSQHCLRLSTNWGAASCSEDPLHSTLSPPTGGSQVFLNPELDKAAQCDFLWIW